MSNNINTSNVISVNSSIFPVECKIAFDALSVREKYYSFHFARASWLGQKTCYFQRSYESPALFYLFQKIFIKESPQELRARLLANAILTEDEVKQLFIYIGAFFSNCGNYKSFGDCKFVPQLDKALFLNAIHATLAYAENKEVFDHIWEVTNKELYESSNPYQVIEFINNQGLSGYYSPNVSQQDAEKINRFLEQETISISPLNTWLIKHSENQYELLIASVETQNPIEHEFEGVHVRITYGHLSPFMREVRDNLAQAIPHAENEHQVKMINAYLRHFTNGSIDEHKESQRHWIKDKGPIIETNIGFIESYLDPLKVRAEFQGFVSVVNKLESVKLEKLVSNAENIIKNLPWPREFEVEKFSKPDFTSLEVVTFAGSGIPIGINIPNYDDIRQTEGFKNVNLGNMYDNPSREFVQFTPEEIKDLYCKYIKDSIFVLVALHELLGHGTGKLLQKNKEGQLNFELGKVIHPILNEPVKDFYESNETWHSKFGDVSSGYEECRADSVALYLSCFQECLDILVPQYSKEEQEDLVYIQWYCIIQKSIKALEFYNPQLKKWGQAHCAARFVITQVLIEAGEGLVTFENITLPDGSPYVHLRLDKSKIWTVGKEAMRKFLIGLQAFKSTGDSVRGTAFFNKYAAVNEEMLAVRAIAVANKLPQRLCMQVGLKFENENVQVVQFENSVDGLIQSYVHHYEHNVEDVLVEWKKYSSLFRLKQE